MTHLEILLVEDDVEETSFLKQLLESFGYSVPHVVGCGKTSITMARETKPDLILMDIKSSDNGIASDECIKTQREIKQLDLPAVFLAPSTSYADEFRQKTKSTDPVSYITKPYDDFELKHVIELTVYKNDLVKEFETSENYYEAIFEHTGAATVIIEEDTTISLANSEFEKLSGYSREEIEGKKSWTEFIPEEDQEKMKEYHRLRRIDPTLAPLTYDFRFVDREGVVKNIHLDIGMIPGTQKSVGSLLDITELKQFQEALAKSEKKFRSALDNMMEGCQIIGYDWTYLYVNDAVSRQGHFNKEELLGHTMMEMYPGIEDTELFAVLRRCMGRRVSDHFDNKFIYPDGKTAWFELSIHPVSEGIFILSIDITERMKTQEEIMIKNTLLEEKIKKEQERLQRKG